MKVIIPMAGRGSRFAGNGTSHPKPLIDVAGKPMIAWALQSLAGIEYSQLIFVILEEHDAQYQLLKHLVQLASDVTTVVSIPHVTEGQLCTVLSARDFINTEEDILIASCDTYVSSNLSTALATKPKECRGIISVAKMPGDRWSFARADATGRVLEVAEKKRISDFASTGLYYFSSGREFVEISEQTIKSNSKTIGEFYVMPVYNQYLERGWRVDICEEKEMWDMGTPEALRDFVQSPFLQRQGRHADSPRS